MRFLQNRRRRAAAALLLVVLLLLLLAFWRFGPDAQLAEVRRLREQLMGESGRNLSPEQRRELGQQLGQAMQQLSPRQRQALSQERRQRAKAEMDRYFKLPKREQLAYLDAQIDRMEAARKQGQSNRPPGAAGPGGRPNGPPLSAEDRERRRKQRLDESTPEERAERAEFFKQLNSRRQQRNLPPLGPGRVR